MDADLRTALDHIAIGQVMARYCRGIDRVDMDLVRSAYWPDARDDHGPYQGSLDGFIDWVEPNVSQHRMTHHFLGQSLIRLDGDKAVVETYFDARHVKDVEDGDQMLAVLGRYLDLFERRGGEWRIAKRDVVVDMRHYSTLGVEGRAGQGAWMGKHSREDRTYAHLP